MKNIISLLFITTILLFACKSSKEASSGKSSEKVSPSTETWIIASKQVKCDESTADLCFQVKKLGETEYTPMNVAIENFMYESGFKYQIQVNVIPSKKEETKYMLLKELFKVASK